ncbi:cell division protein FtsQ/DivIB [Methylosarcina fibrata]|uniref:cell division protein FtsQ/DivIB n=1 Tax=Methylosarcina fibrata TaxID=105972 RepID=UPI000370D957|nr:cell division protein FtsQ/DivIB [Methylosarcina fibrata]
MQAVKIVATLLLLAGVIWIYGYKLKKYGNEAIPIKYVRTEGVFQHISKDEIKRILLPLVKTGILTADMQAIHNAVGQLPWVDTVSVKRVWPDAIDIRIKEKKPYARWGENSLINEQGVIFTPDNVDQFQSLTLLNGPEKQQIKALEIMKGVKTALADQSMEMVEFDINNRWSWKIRLATGMEILLGRTDQLMKLQRFLRTLALLGEDRVKAMSVVDLRYPNGYAVSWRPGSEKVDWEKMANPQQTTDRQPETATKSKQNGKKNRT